MLCPACCSAVSPTDTMPLQGSAGLGQLHPGALTPPHPPHNNKQWLQALASYGSAMGPGEPGDEALQQLPHTVGRKRPYAMRQDAPTAAANGGAGDLQLQGKQQVKWGTTRVSKGCPQATTIGQELQQLVAV